MLLTVRAENFSGRELSKGFLEEVGLHLHLGGQGEFQVAEMKNKFTELLGCCFRVVSKASCSAGLLHLC